MTTVSGDDLFLPQQFGRDRLFQIDPFRVLRDADDPVGPGQGGDGAGPAGQGVGNHFIPHLAEIDPQEFLLPQFGGKERAG